jgi:hypothetical protein
MMFHKLLCVIERIVSAALAELHACKPTFPPGNFGFLPIGRYFWSEAKNTRTCAEDPPRRADYHTLNEGSNGAADDVGTSVIPS